MELQLPRVLTQTPDEVARNLQLYISGYSQTLEKQERNYENETVDITKNDELVQSFLKMSEENLTNLWSNEFDDAWDKV